jgi:protein involved in polysaccharide export with SLBB domain
MKKIGVLLLWTSLGLLMSGCFISKRGPEFNARAYRKAMALTNFTTVSTTNTVNPEWLQPSTNFFTLGPGDKLEIEILGDTSSRAIAQVMPDGKIYYNLLPGIDVWGLTLPETRQVLEKALQQYLTSPQVSLQLRGIDSTRVWVLGRVANPGVYPMVAPMTLLEAISNAGGSMTSTASGTTEDLADLSHSFVVRNGERLPVNFDRLLTQGDMSQNIYLHPDDLVFLPSSLNRDIYVLGAVRTPKAVARQQGTLLAAIADAGGPIKNAQLSQVAIVRGSMDNPKIAIVDYGDIAKGKAPDVLLEPHDIIYVPFSPYRFLTKYLDLIMLTFVRAVAINEGARAAEPNSAPAGVNIGIVGGTGTILIPGGTVIPGPGGSTTVPQR